MSYDTLNFWCGVGSTFFASCMGACVIYMVWVKLSWGSFVCLIGSFILGLCARVGYDYTFLALLKEAGKLK